MNGRFPTTIKKLIESYKNKVCTPQEVTQYSLQLNEKLSNVNGFVTTVTDIANQSAAASTERYNNSQSVGQLDGVPIAVKDNFCTNNIKTSCGSRMLNNFIAPYNATVWDRLQASGSIIIGKTNLDEFGMGSGTVDSIIGPTRNVWDQNRIVGGSSGGSAVSVASGICYGALGSDTGGSTRNPASYCGVVGLKPTYGLVSRYGLIPLVNSMDVPGILARCVDDCLELLNVIAGPDQLDSTTIKIPFQPIQLHSDLDTIISQVKIGIPIEYYCEGLSDEILETWMKIADLLEDGGAKTYKISLPNTASSIFVYTILNQCEVASNMARYDGIEFGLRADDQSGTEQLYAKSREMGFNSVVKNRILTGNYFLLRRNYEKYFEKALRVRRLIKNDFVEAFKTVDVLLTPTTLTEAPLYKDFIANSNRDQCAVQDYCTQSANMAGIPAITIPIRLSLNNMPLSLQLMGRNLSERTLLSVAKWIEKQVQFPNFYR